MEYLTEELIDKLKTPSRVVVTMHRDPDADAMGSSLAWAAFLKKIGHTVSVISPTEVAENLHWLGGFEEVLNFENRNGDRVASLEVLQNAELIFCLDFSSQGRLKELAPFVMRTQATIITIDHHLEPEDFAHILISDTSAAATAQIVYRLIREWDESLMDDSIAESLYAGIMTDTGSFRHNSTTQDVHLTVANLMQYGLDVNKVHRLIYDNSSLSRIQMLGHSLSNMVVLPDFRVSYMVLDQSTLKKFQSASGDTDGIVNYGLQVKDVVMTALFVERPNEVKISFRSVSNFSVREVANAHFEGGGHKNAAGGRSNLSLSATIEKFLGILPHYHEQLLAAEK